MLTARVLNYLIENSCTELDWLRENSLFEFEKYVETLPKIDLIGIVMDLESHFEEEGETESELLYPLALHIYEYLKNHIDEAKEDKFLLLIVFVYFLRILSNTEKNTETDYSGVVAC